MNCPLPSKPSGICQSNISIFKNEQISTFFFLQSSFHLSYTSNHWKYTCCVYNKQTLRVYGCTDTNDKILTLWQFVMSSSFLFFLSFFYLLRYRWRPFFCCQFEASSKHIHKLFFMWPLSQLIAVNLNLLYSGSGYWLLNSAGSV